MNDKPPLVKLGQGDFEREYTPTIADSELRFWAWFAVAMVIGMAGCFGAAILLARLGVV